MLKAPVIQLAGAFCNDMYYTKYVLWNGIYIFSEQEFYRCNGSCGVRLRSCY